MKFLTREDVRAALSRRIVCGFEGVSVTPELREILREVRPLGLILFARNIESPEALRELNRELKSLRTPDEPLLLCVDQEGGRVARVGAPASVFPPMRRLGQLNDPEATMQVGALLGAEMRSLNFDVNFAPVLDVNTNPDNPVIGDRAFSNDPGVVATHGVALLRGLHSAGIAACGKHFPGHGDTNLDSHFALPLLDHSPERLEQVEWPPFVAAIQAGAQAIMSAHLMVPALDEKWPGTLSPIILGQLRNALGFSGLIFSDDIEMQALIDHHSLHTIATQGSQAGIDIFLPCKTPDTILSLYRALVRAAEDNLISHQDIQNSNQRICRFRQRFYADPVLKPMPLGSAQNAAFLRTLDERISRLELE